MDKIVQEQSVGSHNVLEYFVMKMLIVENSIIHSESTYRVGLAMFLTPH